MSNDLETFLHQADPDLLLRLGAAWDPNRKVYVFNGGASVTFSDWTSGAMYSAVDISRLRESGGQELTLFNYGRSQALPGSLPIVYASELHTNVPRSGQSGLPQGYEGLIYGVTARMSWAPELDVAVNRWIDSAVVKLVYNHKYAFQLPLRALFTEERQAIDRATSGVAIKMGQDERPSGFVPSTMEGILPIHMKENLDYHVVIQSTSEQALFHLTTALQQCGDGGAAAHEAAVRLRVAARFSSTVVSQIIDEALELLAPTRPLLLWIDLLGFWKRPII